VKIAVIGGAGYVGSAAVRHLLSSGHEVSVLDDLSAGHRDAIPSELLRVGELSDRASLGSVLGGGCDLVMHFAAFASVGDSVVDPRAYYRNNVASTLTLLEEMVDRGVSRIVFSSSCSIYAPTEDGVLDEGAPADPQSPYAFSKYAMERMITDFSRAYGLGYALLRYFNAAGASPDGLHGEDHGPETHLIPIVIQSALGQRGPVQIFGNDYATPDGTCVRDYVHVDDLASAHELAARWLGEGSGARGEAINVGTGRGYSVLEVVSAVERVTGKQIAVEHASRRPGDTPRLVAQCAKLEKQLGWSARYAEIDETIATAWQWHRNHPDGYSQ
jgi:UDP-glucose 4-epimerase